MSTFKPMLAATVEQLETLRWPKLLSPKLDGVRCLIIGGRVMSRNLKEIPNAHVQKLFGLVELEGLDGELIVGSPNSPTVYLETVSGVMTATGEPNVWFMVFDKWDAIGGFRARLDAAAAQARAAPTKPPLMVVKHSSVSSIEALKKYEEKMLVEGYEGVMLRCPAAPYKHGRSTPREQGLVKLKQFTDSEAEVIGYEELQHNGNELQRDELGRAKRTSHKANKTGRGTLGALVCRWYNGVEFNIGTGFDDATRFSLWAGREQLVGRWVKFKYFPTGSKEAPRFPTFLGFRSTIDM